MHSFIFFLADGVKSQRKAIASLAARVQEEVHRMEDNNHATQQRLNATVVCLIECENTMMLTASIARRIGPA
jgi:hypothetical protein